MMMTTTEVQVGEVETQQQQQQQQDKDDEDNNHDDDNNDVDQEVVKKDCPFPLKCFTNKKLFHYDVNDATGFQCYMMGNGPLVISNIFLAASLLKLARRSIGCEDDDTICEGRVYGGFKPSSLIAIIGTISSLLSAFLLPIIGAIIDYTNYRKLFGIVSSSLIIIVQAVQIFTMEGTWFPMAILQALNGFFFEALSLCSYSYLSEIRRVVGDSVMVRLTPRFYISQFTVETIFLIFIVGVGRVINADEVKTGQISQGADVIVTGVFYALSMYFFTDRESKKELPRGSSLVTAGFKQVFMTAKGIVTYYSSTLAKFFVAVIFGQAATAAYTTIAVTFLVEVVKLNSTTTGLVFIVVLMSIIPGNFCSKYLMRKTNPIVTVKVCVILYIIINFATFLTLTGPEVGYLVWPYSAIWGFMLGWYLPTEMHIYSALMPKGQEAELSGFYLYCTQILTWLPPLIFTIMNEGGISLNWGGVHLNIYFFLALVFYQLLPPWDKCLDAANADNKILMSMD